MEQDKDKEIRRLAEMIMDARSAHQDIGEKDIQDVQDMLQKMTSGGTTHTELPPVPGSEALPNLPEEAAETMPEMQKRVAKEQSEIGKSYLEKAAREGEDVNKLLSMEEMAKAPEDFGKTITRASDDALVKQSAIRQLKDKASKGMVRELLGKFGKASGKDIAKVLGKGALAATGMTIPAIAEGFDAEALGPQKGDEGYEVEEPAFKSRPYGSEEEKEASDEELRALVQALNALKGEEGDDYEGTMIQGLMGRARDKKRMALEDQILKNIENR